MAKKPISKAEKEPASHSSIAKQFLHRKGHKWNLNKLEMGHFLSETCFYRVTDIERDGTVSVQPDEGDNMSMGKNLIETLYSADHYEKEVALNMTGLAELLQSVSDVIFTVTFRKQVSEADVADLLVSASGKDFTDAKLRSALSKQII